MDLLIKNIEMPKSCVDCNFTHICKAIKKLERKNVSWKKIYVASVGRLVDCPLIELPLHGDLIDRQTVLSYFETGFLMGANMDYEDINEIVRKVVPTVLEAST